VTERLAHRAWPTIRPASFAIVPLGSTEQHGPHLPFDTDSVIAAAVARGIATHQRDAVPAQEFIVAPTIPYGASGEHQSFPGTISIGHDALVSSLIELVRSLSTWATRILIVNGHGGNLSALSIAVPQMIAEQHPVAWVPCTVPESDAHAGRTETSLMLHLAPSTVNLQLAVPGLTTPVESFMDLLAAHGVRAVSETGILGDPLGSSASEGIDLLAAMVGGAVRRLNHDTHDSRGCLRDPAVIGSSR
jgi:mycofactocin system creatininase family protein